MKQAMAATASRTGWGSRLVLALTVALTLGTMLAPEVDASKKGKNAVASVKIDSRGINSIAKVEACRSPPGTRSERPQAG